MFTVDASVHVSALNPTEASSANSAAFLELLRRRATPVISPTLLVVEVAAALSRRLGDHDVAIRMALAVRRLPEHKWIPLDDSLSETASNLAATQRLRGADAVYAAVARNFGTILVTLDEQQLDRLPPAVVVKTPIDAMLDLR